MSELAFSVESPDEIFAEQSGEVRISYDDLAALPDAGRDALEKIRAYVIAHPKLEARFSRHDSSLLGVELIIQWRWRR